VLAAAIRWGFWLLSDIDDRSAMKEKLVDAADLGGVIWHTRLGRKADIDTFAIHNVIIQQDADDDGRQPATDGRLTSNDEGR
jgi:hypothetical protein